LAQLKKHGPLTGQRIGQIITSVAIILNGQSDETNEKDRQKVTSLHNV